MNEEETKNVLEQTAYAVPQVPSQVTGAFTPTGDSVAMTPQQISDAYSVLAGQVRDYGNAQAQRAGYAQQTMGTLAGRTMGGSQTAGLGNYTYNRTLRPTLDSLTSSLVAEGVSAALNRQLSEALNQAKRNYDRSSLAYSTKSTTTSKKLQDIEDDPSGPGNDDTVDNPELDFSADYKFDNLGNIPGQDRKYPTTVTGPDGTITYSTWGSQYKDAFEKGDAWVDYLKSIGYGG